MVAFFQLRSRNIQFIFNNYCFFLSLWHKNRLTRLAALLWSEGGKGKDSGNWEGLLRESPDAVYISLPLLTERSSFAKRVKGWLQKTKLAELGRLFGVNYKRLDRLSIEP